MRVKPDADRLLRDSCPACDRPGCAEPGLYPAPKGRGQEGQYHRFCLDHVREYNKGYNYFAGLPDEDVIQHQKDDTIGHRPTWFIGVNAVGDTSAGRATARAQAASPIASRPSIRSTCSPSVPPRSRQPACRSGTIKRAERKCLRQLNLEDNATKADIKARFKELVKRLHPDHNKGDRRSEDKLREVIQAYNYLRQAGLA